MTSRNCNILMIKLLKTSFIASFPSNRESSKYLLYPRLPLCFTELVCRQVEMKDNQCFCSIVHSRYSFKINPL